MNLGQLRSAIQSHGYTSDTASNQNDFINQAYRRVHGQERWKFLEKQNSTLFTVFNTPNYNLPMTDWRNLDAVRIQVVNDQHFDNLKFLPEQMFRDYYHVDRDASNPFYWTLMDQQLWFYPVPDQAYQVVIDYIMEPPDLVADGDQPVIPLPYQDILVWGAIKALAFRERDWIGADIAGNEYSDILEKMKEEYMIKQRQTASHVQKSGYWNTQLPYPFVQEGF